MWIASQLSKPNAQWAESFLFSILTSIKNERRKIIGVINDEIEYWQTSRQIRWGCLACLPTGTLPQGQFPPPQLFLDILCQTYFSMTYYVKWQNVTKIGIDFPLKLFWCHCCVIMASLWRHGPHMTWFAKNGLEWSV